MATISWRPGIGDPSLLGWLTVVAYVIAAMLCTRASLVPRQPAPSGENFPRVWAVFALVLLLLGLNKQLDLQTLLIEAGRQLALSEGWYEKRRAVQTAFTAILAVGMLAILALLVRLTGRFVARHPLVVPGTLLLISYVLIRASAFDHLGSSRGVDLDHLRWTGALELSGIACIAIAATRARSRADPTVLGDKLS